MTDPAVAEAKRAARNRVWDVLEHENAAPRGVHGHIPNFVGAQDAAARLAGLEVWNAARVVKCNPDRAQLPVRIRALQQGKLVYMAVPRLATPAPFYVLDPDALPAPIAVIATATGAADHAAKVDVANLLPVDLIVCGSVAVDRSGVRVGKGAGYADIEVALLTDAGLISDSTIIVTTVHQLQVVEDLPRDEHDFIVDVVVTPDEVIYGSARHRPAGILREQVTAEQADAIPVLRPYLPG